HQERTRDPPAASASGLACALGVLSYAVMAPALRIVSFLPSATEMACALGLAEQLVGVTHECDYPQEIKGKPIVVRSVLPVENMREKEIDRGVSDGLRNKQSLYRGDEQLLRALPPAVLSIPPANNDGDDPQKSKCRCGA